MSIESKIREELKQAMQNYESQCGYKANYPNEQGETWSYEGMQEAETIIFCLTRILGHSDSLASGWCYAVSNLAEEYDDVREASSKTRDEFEAIVKVYPRGVGA